MKVYVRYNHGNSQCYNSDDLDNVSSYEFQAVGPQHVCLVIHYTDKRNPSYYNLKYLISVEEDPKIYEIKNQ